MTIGIEAVTTAAIGRALDAASLRHQAIANNIANVNTEGYRRLMVNFDEQFEGARRSLEDRGSINPLDLVGIQLQVVSAADTPGYSSAIKLDMEMVSLAQNAIRFQTLTKGLSKHFSLLLSAVSDGKK